MRVSIYQKHANVNGRRLHISQHSISLFAAVAFPLSIHTQTVIMLLTSHHFKASGVMLPFGVRKGCCLGSKCFSNHSEVSVSPTQDEQPQIRLQATVEALAASTGERAPLCTVCVAIMTSRTPQSTAHRYSFILDSIAAAAVPYARQACRRGCEHGACIKHGAYSLSREANPAESAPTRPCYADGAPEKISSCL